MVRILFGLYSIEKSFEKGGKSKFDFVMKEFAEGKLHDRGGKVVKDRNQAVALAYSESGLNKADLVDGDQKISKEEINYIDNSSNWEEKCSVCLNFIKKSEQEIINNNCKRVQGNINKNGYCDVSVRKFWL